jgi:hypothetical protein
MLALFALPALLAGCGDDGGAGADAGPDAPPGAACADGVEPTTRFTVTPEPGAASRIGSQVGGQVESGAAPRLAATLVTEGACRFVGARPALCDPACTGDTVCDVDGACVGFPSALAAGSFHVTGTTPPVTLTPQAGNGYYADRSYPGLFRPDDVITMTLDGAGPVAPLTATVRGVPVLTLPTAQLTAREHQPMVVRWDPITAPTTAQVLVHFDSDHHGVLAYLECTAPAAAGSLTIPASILDPVILAGETGIGTFIENAWIEVHDQVRIDTPRGCAVFQTYSDEFVDVTTVRAP